jgi:hypothetical protein
MIDDRTVAFCEIELKRIVIINFEDNSVRHIPHIYLKNQTNLLYGNFSLQLYYFSHTNLLGLVEQNEQESKMMITYYSTLEVYKGPIDQYIRFCKPKFIAKSDAHSMITWMEGPKITFYIYDLKSELK